MQCQDDMQLFDLQDNATKEFFHELDVFNQVYTVFHRYLCAVLCTVGVIVNTLHFFVLSRRAMRAYIINALLCAMAVCDALTMASYLVYIIRFRIFDNPEASPGYPYSWLVFLIVHVTSSIAFHTGSLYLSVIMAYIRWTALDRLDAKWINSSAIKHIFFFTAFSVTFVSIPNLLVHKIVSLNDIFHTNQTEYDHLYTVELDQSGLNGCMLFRANLWITGIFFKAVPCALLLWFTIALIWKLCEMSEKRRLLRGDGNNNRKTKLSIDKTTLMLIIMLVVFLCTELPQGLLAILSAIYPTHIHMMVYVNVGEVLDLLSLVNCLTSFVLYVCMSSTYRATVKQLFMPNHKTAIQKTTLAAQSLKLLIS